MQLISQRFQQKVGSALIALALSSATGVTLAATSMSQNERMDAKKALIKAIDPD